MHLSIVPICQDQQRGSLHLDKYPSLRGKRKPKPFEEERGNPLFQNLLPLDFSLGDTAFRVTERTALEEEGPVIGHIARAVKTIVSAILGKLDATGVHNSIQLRKSADGGYLDLTMMQIFQILHRVNIGVPTGSNRSFNDGYRGFTGQIALCEILNGLHPRSAYELTAKLGVASDLGWSYVSTGFEASRGFVEYVGTQKNRNDRRRFKRKIERGDLNGIAEAAGAQSTLARDDVFLLLRALACDGKYLKPGDLQGLHMEELTARYDKSVPD